MTLGSSACLAQQEGDDTNGLSDPYNLEPKAHGNYLLPLDRLRPLRDRYRASTQWRDLYFELLATDESFVGNDAEAIADFDSAKSLPTIVSDTKTNSAVTALQGYEPVDARQAVLKLADTHRVLFINEAHHVSQGRAFILSLLKGLYQRGFRYYAAETLNQKDGDLQKRGYPIQQTGYLTTEPVFGDLIRTALTIGFKVVPYEYQGSKSLIEASDPLAEVELRERGEAQNLYDRTLKHDPNAKIIVHAGYGHIYKQVSTMSWSVGDLGMKKAGGGTFIPMAVYFQRMSGIMPFSIDQADLFAHSAPAYESPLYRYMTAQRSVKDVPVVFRNVRGQYYVPPTVRGGYDVIICHPRPQYQNGRPTWLRMGGQRRPIAIPPAFAAPQTGSVLVQAFYRNEDPSQAVPVDQVEISAGNGPLPALMLPKGRFLLRIVDVSGKP